MNTRNLSDQYYLNIAHVSENIYYEDFVVIFDNLCKFLSPAKEKIFNQKLQILDNRKFNEGSFIQIACETTVCSYFLEKYSEGFFYECKTTTISDKDVDCQFTDGKYTYNVEVKCPGLDTYKEKFHENPKIEIGGRFSEEGKKLINTIEEALQDKLKANKSEWNYTKRKRLDNTLKTFLQEANSKFPSVEITDQVNILVVCCDDQKDMDRWIGYLYHSGGLFTEDSFVDVDTYNRVDIVILTNLFNRHYSFADKVIQGNSWDFSDAFNLCFCNPLKNNTYKAFPIRNFIGKFNNYTTRLISFIDKEINSNPAVEYFPVQHFTVEFEKYASVRSENKIDCFAIWK